MKIFEMLAEQRIKDAQRRGEFDALPGRGHPLALDDDDPFVADDTRTLNRVMKNAGLAPGEIGLRRELALLREHLREETDLEKCRKLRQRIALLATDLSESAQRRTTR